MENTQYVYPAKDGFRLLCAPAKLYFKLTGWTLAGEPPALDKYVLIGAPHTSNWDGMAMIGGACLGHIRLKWMAKKSLFRWPIRRAHKWIGGIEIDRSQAGNVVDQAVEAFARSQRLILLITPEGTRSRRDHWRSGFYHIAMGAGVPIAMAYLNYPSKTVGFGPTLIPTGDIEADMGIIREFYADKVGKYPENASDICLRPRTTG